MKKLLSLLLVIISSLALLLFKYYSPPNEEQNIEATIEAVAQKIVSRAEGTGESNDEESEPKAKEQLAPAKLSELEGRIHNEYGIRDDVLRFIEIHIPPDNKEGLKAAIKYAQYENQIHYHAKTQEEALALDKKAWVALTCLGMALPNAWDEVTTGAGKLLNDTPERREHIHEVDQRFFAWKSLGSDLTHAEEEAKCKSGDY